MSKAFLLRNRSFTLVWFSQILSQGGTRIYQIALLWWLLGALPPSSRGLASGAFLVLGALPALLLAGRIGRVVDRIPSRRVLVGAEVIAGVLVSALAVLALAGTVPVWVVYPIALALASCQAFFDPCLMKSVPELVPPPDIERAVGLCTSTQSAANFAGAACGAGLLATIGFSGAIVVNAATYVVSACCLLAVRFRPSADAPQDTRAPQRTSTWRFLGSLPGVRPLLVCFAMVNFFSAPTLLVLPLYTRTVLGAGPSTLAVLKSALWFGLLAGALCAPRIGQSAATTRFGAVYIALFGMLLAIPGLAAAEPISALCLAAAGFCLGTSNVKFTTLFTEVVPAAVRGRFFAALMASVSATFPVAFLVFGAAGDGISAQLLCLAQGGGLLVLATLLARLPTPPVPAKVSPQLSLH